MRGQCKHCSHFCTGRIGSVVSLEWSLKLQGCYLGVCWWTHIGICPWPHPATTACSCCSFLMSGLAWMFCHPCPLQQHGGCSVLPVQNFLKSYLRPSQTKEELFVAFPALGSTLDIGIGFSILASVSVKKDHIFWHYPSYIWVKKRGPHPTIQMAHFGWIAHALLLMYRCCIVFHLSF